MQLSKKNSIPIFKKIKMLPTKFRLVYQSILLFFCCLVANAQEPLELGKIIDSVAVTSTNDDTYAIYLPTSFEKDALSSIVFVFEPAARGVVGVRPFVEASEEFGHIIVCSNNSKNGPMEKSFEIANALFNHIFNTYNIKENEMYVSGFSGGARLATAIATLTNQFGGVIACGAGFSSVPSHIPSIQNFKYVGLCGNEDMNYREMRNNKAYLNRIKFGHTLVTFDGDHSWPPQAQITKAFRWCYAQKEKDPNLLLPYLQKAIFETRELVKNDHFLLADENYERILGTYKTFFTLDSITTEHSQLRKSKLYKKASKSLASSLEKEEGIMGKLRDRLKKDFASPKKADLGWWEKEIANLDEDQKDISEQQRKMFARVKFGIFVDIYYRSQPDFYNSNESQLALSKKLLSIIKPKEE